MSRHAATRELLGSYLTFTPRPVETDRLEADMGLLNRALLDDAIKEATAVREKKGVPADQQRLVLHQIYTRKVKELSSLYPFIFAVENSLRSSLADHSARKFGRMDWWILIRDARAAGYDHTHFPNIATVPVNGRFVQAVFRGFERMSNPAHKQSVAGPDRTDQFYYTLSLGDLWNILKEDWNMTRGMFCSDHQFGLKLTSQVFDQTMRVIKDARNEIFHSNPIRNRTKVIEACERILNGLGIHLGDYDADLGAAQAGRATPKVARTDRHLIPAR
ncbi:hypothetical protein HCU64_12720 [Methylobacterium sp. C25]|uniref:hypothetical protein n=1 Tax=Methylobacterium sp. C25 TaxID=2721622 RepID=UPI001F3A2991|nr:hypothetical protein [Methylobacterium sp. C25]MCE4224621.1 hypothetical protein [Methylobacterium sp. C25]